MSNTPHLEAVAARIAGAILNFCRLNADRDWHADDLRRYVDFQVGPVAPGSADRILRSLRAKGQVRYECVSRSASLYRVLGMGTP